MNLNRLDKAVRLSRIVVISIFIVVISIHILWFFSLNNQVLSKNPSDWGVFGDFVGGLLNPLIAFMAFYWLTISVLIQKTELSETKAALVESKEAQLQQARSTEKSMRIQAVNIQLEAINTELRGMYGYRSFVLEHGSGPNTNYQMLTETGSREKADDLIEPLANRILELERKQKILLERSEEILNEI